MRDGWKFALGIGALVLAGAAFSDAKAGNAVISGVEYFSVQMNPGQVLSYTGSETDATLLIDDITYTAQIDPCDLWDRCEFFTVEELSSAFGPFYEEDQDSGVIQNTSPDIYGGTVTTTSRTQRFAGSWVKAKGAYLGAQLSEGSSGGVFDAMTHTLYGEVAAKFKRTEASSASRGEVSPFGGGIYATDALAYTENEALAMSTWAVQTSESRHYQTPQIIQDDNNVTFSLETALTDYGSYVNARVYIKGRILLGTTGVPAENADVTVTTP